MDKLNLRRFEAALNYESLQSWISFAQQTFADELSEDVPTVRARSREAAINDGYARRYFKLLKQMVVGPNGIKLKMNVRGLKGNPKIEDNQLIEAKWETYSRAVSVDGRNLRQTLGLFLETCARDGEAFAVIKRGNEFGPHKIQLQMLEADYLDYKFKGKLKNGNNIESGIEYDKLMRPVAYHFFTEFPRSTGSSSGKRVRVLAEDVIHGFDRDRCSQGRGYPWLAAGLISLAHIKAYTQTEMVAARVAAAKFAVYTQDNVSQPVGDYDDENDDQARRQEVEAGVIEVLKPGQHLEMFDAKHPNGNFAGFVKAILRRVSVSVGIGYNTLSEDYQSVNYSSARQGLINERETYMELQQFLIETLLNRLFTEWLAMMLGGQLDGVRIPLRLIDQFNKPSWRPRTHPWVDPSKEMSAYKMQLDYGIVSKSHIARKLGLEYNEMIDEIAAENKYAEEQGVNLSINDVTRAMHDKMIEQWEDESKREEESEDKDDEINE